MKAEPYPLIGDDLIGSLLYRVHAQHRQAPFALSGVRRLALGAGGSTAGIPRGSEVIQVQVLFISKTRFLQSFEQDIRMVPYLRAENKRRQGPYLLTMMNHHVYFLRLILRKFHWLFFPNMLM